MLIIYILVTILILLEVYSLVRLVVRLKRAGKGNWTFRVSWKYAIVQGIRILVWLAGVLLCMCNGYNLWGGFFVFVIVDVTAFIDESIHTQE